MHLVRAHAGATALQFYSRYRLGFMAIAPLIVLMVLAVQLLPAELAKQTIAGTASFPLAGALVFVLGVFSFGLEIDISAKASGFPSRMFTLPSPTWLIVFWPMAYGAAA